MDPEVREFGKDKKMARIQLATSDKFKNKKGELVEDTQWHNVVIWGNLAGIAEKHLQKGSEVAISGKLVHRQFETTDGKKQFVTEVNAYDLLMLRRPAKA